MVSKNEADEHGAVLQFRVPVELYDQLKKRAAEQDCSIAAAARQALRKGLAL